MISTVVKALILLLLVSAYGYSQDPLPVLSSEWRFATQKAPRVEVPTTGPARAITNDDKPIQRNLRQIQVNNQPEPSETTPDGYRAQIEKMEQQARTPQPEDVRGFTYSTRVRNDSGMTVKVIFWEYRFTELARPENVVRRQFICGVNMKKGAEIELTVFSTRGPTDSVDVESLSRSKEKLFDEKVQVNRIEFADDSILQRGNWKFADVRDAVTRATATPWGKETCRAL